MIGILKRILFLISFLLTLMGVCYLCRFCLARIPLAIPIGLIVVVLLVSLLKVSARRAYRKQLMLGCDFGLQDEWLLEVDLAMIDTHGAPKCTAEVKIGTEWVEVSEGVWKPLGTDHPYAPKLFPARITGEPSALRLTCSGYGDCGLCHVSLRNRSRRFVPAKVVSTSGRVQDAENLLVDDFRGMRFGLADCTAAFCDQRLSQEESSLELELRQD